MEAQSALDPGAKATATVTVAAKLELLAGKVGGGSGNVDGKGNAARFDQPNAVAVHQDTLYIADTGNHTIRKADLVTGEVTLVAGQPGIRGDKDGSHAEPLLPPARLAYAGGSLFVPDDNGFRRITLSAPTVTKVSGYPAVVSLAWDRGESLFFATTNPGSLYRMALETSAVEEMFLTDDGAPFSATLEALAWDGTSLVAVALAPPTQYLLVRIDPTSGAVTHLTPTCTFPANPYGDLRGATSLAVAGHYLAFNSRHGSVQLLDLDDVSQVLPASGQTIERRTGSGLRRS